MKSSGVPRTLHVRVWSNGLNISGIFIMALGYPEQPPGVGVGAGVGVEKHTQHDTLYLLGVEKDQWQLKGRGKHCPHCHL